MKQTEASLHDLMPLIRERLAAGQSVRFSPKGISMLPMLRQGKDSVELSPLPADLKKYDLPLYQRDDGSYVLHRVVRVSRTYTCMGDNQFEEEAGVRPDQMIGLVTAFYRGTRWYSVEHPVYRLYCRLWYHSRHLRRYGSRAIRWLKRKLS